MFRLSGLRPMFHLKYWEDLLYKRSGIKKYVARFVRMLVIAFQGFKEDHINLRASALTLFSLLAAVPVVALAFGIAKGFGLKEYLEKQLLENFTGQQEALNWIIRFANSLLEETRGGVIVGIGIVVLLWAVLKVFMNIESSFNAIWQIPKSRNWFRKFSDYFSFILIAPLLLIVSSSATVFLSARLELITSRIEILGFISPFIFFFIRLIPYIVIWLLLVFLYMFLPNTKVRFRSAVVAGIIAGTAFVLTQWVYIHFQVGVSRYNAIYGSFAALPLFMIWLQISWIIVLFGAEISYAEQNLKEYIFASRTKNLSLYYQKWLALIISHHLIHKFRRAENPPTAEEISKSLKLPLRPVRKILTPLVSCNILTEITSEKKERSYQPAQDTDNLTVDYIIRQMEHNGEEPEDIIQYDDYRKIKNILDKNYQLMQDADFNTALKKI